VLVVSKNILIPLSLLMRVIELFDCLDASRYTDDFRYEFANVLWELKVKIQKLELREAYARIIHAKDEDAKHNARMEYLWQKSHLGDVDVDMPF
jgi:hypothetical protein